MPKYRVIYKHTVTLCGEVEADCLEAVFENEIVCLGPGGDNAMPEVKFILVEEITDEQRFDYALHK